MSIGLSNCSHLLHKPQLLEVISEIERWFRNPDIGKQCEAILLTPQVAETFPYPIVVNTIVAKLANIFNTWYGI
jgi:hypothetical protein